MTRREVLHYTAMITGGTLSTPLLQAIITGCTPNKQQTDYTPQFFTLDDYPLISQLTNTILPGDPGPAANDMGVNQIMDHMLANVYNAEYRDEFSANWNALSNELIDKGFMKGSQGERVNVLKGLEQSKSEELADARKSLQEIKGQTVAFYLSTEEVAKNYLNYLPVPGAYEGCISLEEVGGKAWAL